MNEKKERQFLAGGGKKFSDKKARKKKYTGL